MRIRVLKDSNGASELQFQPHELTHAVANDVAPLAIPALNPAETYLLSLAAGSRRTMTQALNVIADLILPGFTAATLDWSRVGYVDVARVRAVLSERYSPNTANKTLAALRGAMKATFRLGLINSDSLARTIDIKRIRGERTAKGRSLDSNEITRLVTACDRTTALGIRNAAIVAIGFGCGLRRAELVGLNVGDVLEQWPIATCSREREQGKARLPALTRLGCTWRLGWSIGAHQDGPLFCAVSHAGISPRRLTEQTVYDVLQSLASKARIAHISPHDLRSYLPFLIMSRAFSVV